MLRSLYTGISGMRSHQTMMDVTGNNIANVNTTGYKSSSVQFADTLSQTLAGASRPEGDQGGTNPAQVGLGVRVAGITTNFNQGATQATGKNTDMLISGDGFFMVREGGESLYTRAGSFNLDVTGQLVNPTGGVLQGWQARPDGTVDSSEKTTPITIPTGLLLQPEASENVVMSGNINSAMPAGTSITKKWPIYDAAGKRNDLDVTFTARTATPAGSTKITQWVASVTYGGAPVTGYERPADLAAADAATQNVVEFDADGRIRSVDGQATRTDEKFGALVVEGLVGSDGVPFDVDIELGKLTAYNSGDNLAESSTAKVESDDGAAAGALKSWVLASDGTVTGVFSNDKQALIGRVALATFNNPTGLEKVGGNLYRGSANSGLANVGVAGTGGRGQLVTGALEMSNVDLAQEFTNLIVSQRGFQANSRMITSSDEMLQELVNLKR